MLILTAALKQVLLISIRAMPSIVLDFKPLASSDISPVTAELDKFQDAAKVSGQVKLDKAFATEPKPLFIYDEATVGPDASSYEKNLIVSKLNDEVVPDVFQQVTKYFSSLIPNTISAG